MWVAAPGPGRWLLTAALARQLQKGFRVGLAEEAEPCELQVVEQDDVLSLTVNVMEGGEWGRALRLPVRYDAPAGVEVEVVEPAVGVELEADRLMRFVVKARGVTRVWLLRDGCAEVCELRGVEEWEGASGE